MSKKSLLMMLLLALLVPWAANAQTRDVATVDFETGNISALSAVGTVTNDATYPWTIVDTKNHTDGGTYCMKSTNNGVNSSTSNIEVTVEFNEAGSISFYCWTSCESASSYWDYGIFYIDGTQKDRFLHVTDWVAKTYEVTAGSHTFKWTYTKDSSVGNNDDCFYVDDITFSGFYIPSTPKPTGLAVSNVTDNSATLNWNENGTATSWQICLNDDETNLITTSTKPYELTGLTPLTSYTVKVRAIAGSDHSDWTNNVSFSTKAVAVAVGDAWSDDFEGETCGWELINGTCADAWVWGTATSNGGTHALYISDDGGTSWNYSHNSVKVLAAKLLNFTDGKFEFSYDWYCYGESNYDFLRVALVPASQTLTAGSDYTTITTTSLPTGWIALDGGGKLNQVTTWQNKEVAVNVTAGNYYLVFAWRSDSSTQNQPPAAVDNVSITKMACGYDVAGLAVTEGSITSTGAAITWTAGDPGQWQVAYKKAADSNWTELDPISNNAYTFTNLDPATNYQVKVRAYCGGEDYGAWCNPVSFATECDVIPALGYTENFDSYTASSGFLPLCWSRINTGTSYTTYPYIYNYYSNSTPNCLYFYVYGSASSTSISDQYAVLPEMSGLDGMQITLMARGYSATSTFKIGLMENPADVSTFHEIATQALTTSYQEFVYELSGTGNYVAIMLPKPTGSSSASYGAYIDNISIAAQPACPKPKNLTVVENSINGHGATLSWTSDASAWVVAYSSDGENFRETEANTNPYTLTILDPETNYYVKVRANCGDDGYSEWSNTVNFTTDIACHAPTNLAVSDVEPFAATISWNGTTENYNLRYRAARGFNYGFESAEGFVVDQFPPCTTYDGDGLSTYGIDGYTMPNNTANYVGSVVSFNEYWAAHSGNVMGVFMDAIPSSEVTANDDYFITPALTIAAGDHFTFWARSVTANYGLERMKVGIYGGHGTISTYFAGSADTYVEVPVDWTKYDYDLTAYVGQTIQLAINCVSADAFALLFDDLFVGDPTDNTWDVTLNNVTSPYTLTGLNDETIYEVEVQAACGDEDGTSNWVGTNFMTPSNCAAPTNLAANDITPNAATLSWDGFHDTYNVQYRMAESREIYYFNDFNDQSIEGWTYGGSWIHGFTDPIYNVGGNDNNFLAMGWNSTEEETIISCELPAYPSGAHVEFYYFGNTTANTFQVGFSTTTNDVDAFTWSDPIDAPLSTYTLYNEELADGVKYVAWKATASAQAAAIFIDDFGIFGETIPAGAWQPLSAVTTPYDLAGLTDNTEYEWQVQGINPACDGGVTAWSPMATFTTLDACMTPVIDSVDNITFNGATVYWTGIQDSYNVRYNIFEPATMVNFDDQVIPADWTNDATYAWALTDTLTDGGYCIRSTNQGVASSTSTISFTATYESAGVISFDAMFMGEGTSTAWDKCIFSIDGNQQFAYGQIGQAWYNMAYYFAAGTHTFTWTYSKDSSVNPTGDFFAIDNIKVVLHNDTWTTVENVTGNSYDMTGLTPGSVIAVQVQGNNTVCDGGVTEWSSEYLFITPGLPIQTISLVEGWNWVSIGVAIEDPVEMFEMLTESLGENATEIQAYDYMSEYDDGDWEGDLNEEGVTNEQMYLINAVTDCTIELQGMPAIASEYEITLNPGWNWIGFPSAEPIEAAVALADFEDAEDGDEIQSLDYTIEYYDGVWEGDLEVFEPGQGLLYNNTTDEVKTLVFSTGAKKATRRTVSNFGTLKQVAPRVASIGKTKSINGDPIKK